MPQHARCQAANGIGRRVCGVELSKMSWWCGFRVRGALAWCTMAGYVDDAEECGGSNEVQPHVWQEGLWGCILCGGMWMCSLEV
jgi:hypothetical protein